ncbi:MAG TPA: lipid A biosynthesis acyltransferase [Puia sp.]|jgi:KDO2-lipid IV(A) lauroyltransferase|nr:lipid A biosynthesis acyltransferase [Puia sp.]
MYYLVYGLCYGISLLPTWLLYRISDGLAFILYSLIRYRRRIVMDNLRNAFPEKTPAERLKIARKFYRNFTDSFMETIKLLSASPAWLNRHFVIDNPEVMEDFAKEGRKIQLYLGHLFGWEVANVAMPRLTRFKFIVVYMPVGNKIFERLFLHLRGRTGTVLLPATSMQRAILPYRNTVYALALVADQAPGGPENSYWLDLFGRPTAFIRGAERGARIGDIPAVFARVYKSGRGRYHAQLTTIADHPAQLPEGELTLRYRDLLEAAIREQPATWLWSHKRWKFTWNESFAPLWIDRAKNDPAKN